MLTIHRFPLDANAERGTSNATNVETLVDEERAVVGDDVAMRIYVGDDFISVHNVEGARSPIRDGSIVTIFHCEEDLGTW